MQYATIFLSEVQREENSIYFILSVLRHFNKNV